MVFPGNFGFRTAQQNAIIDIDPAVIWKMSDNIFREGTFRSSFNKKQGIALVIIGPASLEREPGEPRQGRRIVVLVAGFEYQAATKGRR